MGRSDAPIKASGELKRIQVGAGLMTGTAAGKSLVMKLPAAVFGILIDLLLLVSGSALLVNAVFA